MMVLSSTSILFLTIGIALPYLGTATPVSTSTTCTPKTFRLRAGADQNINGQYAYLHTYKGSYANMVFTTTASSAKTFTLSSSCTLGDGNGNIAAIPSGVVSSLVYFAPATNLGGDVPLTCVPNATTGDLVCAAEGLNVFFACTDRVNQLELGSGPSGCSTLNLKEA